MKRDPTSVMPSRMLSLFCFTNFPLSMIPSNYSFRDTLNSAADFSFLLLFTVAAEELGLGLAG